MTKRAGIEEIRSFHARLMAVASRWSDPRLERAFEAIPREAFCPPGPWRIVFHGRPVDTPSADPAYLYQDVLVALDAAKGINNGEPSLHAAWMGAVAPEAGEAVTHVGAGTGYYTAILQMLVLPSGTVTAFEIDDQLLPPDELCARLHAGGARILAFQTSALDMETLFIKLTAGKPG